MFSFLMFLWLEFSGHHLHAIGPARCHTVECQKDGF